MVAGEGDVARRGQWGFWPFGVVVVIVLRPYPTSAPTVAEPKSMERTDHLRGTGYVAGDGPAIVGDRAERLRARGSLRPVVRHR